MLATYQFAPTGGTIVTGTTVAITSAQAISTTIDLNTGSWKGALADDNTHWMVNSTASGIDVNLSVGRVQLNGANTLIIQTEIDEDATSPALLFQICDWTSSTGVDNAADAQCTGGGWRTLNVAKTTVAPTTYTAYHYQIYDGYWGTGSTGGTPISTPLANFVNGSNEIKVRYYSVTNTTTPLGIDYLRVYAVVNPVYSAGGFTNLGTGTPIGSYTSTTIAAGGQTGSDDLRLQVPGTASSISNFYLSFKNIKTYTGMNTILVRAEYSCSATGINHRPKIWNFTSSSWEDLTTASIACSATDAVNAWAKNNITISDYVSNGEARIGWYGLSNSATSLRVDYIYITLGTTNSGVSDYEISFGTNSAGDVTNTRNLDMTGSASTWNIATEDESTAMGHDYYPYNTDMDVTVEEASGANITMSVAPPTNSAVTGIFFAGRFMAGTAGTTQMGIRDYGGFTGTLGGWAAVGAGATTAFVYTDNMTVGGVATGGTAGYTTNPEDFVDSLNGKMNINLRTTADGATTNNSVRQWDFAMVSMQWVETPAPSSITLTLSTTTISLGSLAPGTAINAISTSTVIISNSSTGYNIQVKRDDSNSTLDLTTDASADFSDALSWDPTGSGNASISPGSNLSFRVFQTGTSPSGLYSATWWGANDTDGTAKYAGFSSASQKVSENTSYSASAQTVVYKLRADSPTTQKSGNYDGAITMTALVNP